MAPEFPAGVSADILAYVVILHPLIVPHLGRLCHKRLTVLPLPLTSCSKRLLLFLVSFFGYPRGLSPLLG